MGGRVRLSRTGEVFQNFRRQRDFGLTPLHISVVKVFVNCIIAGIANRGGGSTP